MRATLPILLLLPLLACGFAADQDAPPEPDNSANAAAESLPQADLNASLEQVSELEQPSRFVGNWAVGQDFCRDRTWDFTERELRTPAGSVCRFTEVR